jgi:hypothetical protein
MEREELLSLAKQKMERESLLAAAKQKLAAQQGSPLQPSSPEDNSYTLGDLGEDVKGAGKYVGEKALGAVGWTGTQIDRVGGAPARAAIGAAQLGENPLSAFGSQFGRDPSKAPTGKELAMNAGASDVE